MKTCVRSEIEIDISIFSKFCIDFFKNLHRSTSSIKVSSFSAFEMQTTPHLWTLIEKSVRRREIVGSIDSEYNSFTKQTETGPGVARILITLVPVSYTHLTLPTKRIV